MPSMSLRKQRSTGVEWMQHIPVGFRFCPTDLEAFAYLFCKIYGKHLKKVPLELVQEFDVYESEPCKLPRKQGDEFAYYFTRRSHLSKSKINRYTRDSIGYWRISGSTWKTKAGKKNTLVYYRKSKDEKGKGRKTNWIMHEYVLLNCGTSDRSATARSLGKVVVLCRIYERKEYEEKEIYDSTTDAFDDLPGLLRMLGESNSEILNKADEGDLYCDIENNGTLLNSPTDDRPDRRVNNTGQCSTRNFMQQLDRPCSNISSIAQVNDMDLSLRI